MASSLTLAELANRYGINVSEGVAITGNDYYRKMQDWYKRYFFAFKGWPHTRDNIPNYIHKHPREHPDIYAARLKRAWPINFSRAITNKTITAVYTEQPQRVEIVNGSKMQMFVSDANLRGASLDSVMRQFLRYVYIHGFAVMLVDALPVGYRPSTIMFDSSMDRLTYPYVATYNANCVVDWGYDTFRNLEYILLLERTFENDSVIDRVNMVFTLVTRDKIYRIRQQRKDGSSEVMHKIEEYDHVLSDYTMMPVVVGSMNRDEDDLFTPPSGITELSLIDQAIINYISLRDDIFYSQTYGQLILQAEADDDLKEINVGTAVVLRYPPEMNPPQFITPPSSAVDALNTGIENGVAQIQRISDQRFADVGADTSGLSKEWDFRHEEFGIFSLARIGEQVENDVFRILQLADKTLQMGEKSKIQSIYGSDFDLKGARAFIDDYTALVVTVDLPPTAKKCGDFTAITKVLKNLDEQEKTDIKSELEERAALEEKIGVQPGNAFQNVVTADPNNPVEDQVEGQTTNNNEGMDKVKKPDNRLQPKNKAA